MLPLSIAVVGAGYAGLAVAWYLAQRGARVSLYDSVPIGENTSGIAAGLLHTYTGPNANLAWQGHETLACSQELLTLASQYAEKPVFQQTGILRLALNDKQRLAFQQRSQEHDDITWLEADETAHLAPGSKSLGGIMIRNGITVDGASYLHALWKACESQGMRWNKHNVNSLDELDAYDGVIVAAGMGCKAFRELSHLPLTPVKGQLLELRWPKGQPPLPCPINSHIYCVMANDNTSCYVGATFERGFHNAAPDLKSAKNYLMPKVAEVLPFLADAEVIGIRAGVRACTPDHMPIANLITGNLWTITGLGSKGLLYHAYISRAVSKALLRTLQS